MHLRIVYAYVLKKLANLKILQFNKYVGGGGGKAARTVRNDGTLIWNEVECQLEPLALKERFFFDFKKGEWKFRVTVKVCFETPLHTLHNILTQIFLSTANQLTFSFLTHKDYI